MILDNIQFDLLSIQLAAKSIESFQRANFHVKMSKSFKSALVYLLGKYQAMKCYKIKTNLFQQKNVYKADKDIWRRFLNSDQYQEVANNIKYQAKLSYFILKRTYSQ